MDDEQREHAMAILRAVVRNMDYILQSERLTIQAWREQAESARDSLLSGALTAYGVSLAFLGLHSTASSPLYVVGAVVTFVGGSVFIRRYVLGTRQESQRAKAFDDMQAHIDEFHAFLKGITGG